MAGTVRIRPSRRGDEDERPLSGRVTRGELAEEVVSPRVARSEPVVEAERYSERRGEETPVAADAWAASSGRWRGPPVARADELRSAGRASARPAWSAAPPRRRRRTAARSTASTRRRGRRRRDTAREVARAGAEQQRGVADDEPRVVLRLSARARSAISASAGRRSGARPRRARTAARAARRSSSSCASRARGAAESSRGHAREEHHAPHRPSQEIARSGSSR
jgi:hypothetical protein